MKNFGAPFTAAMAIFILSFAGTVALRLLLLTILAVLAVRQYLQERPALPGVVWAFLACGAFAAGSATWSVDPQMSLGEFKNEFVYTSVAFFSFYVLAKRDDVFIAAVVAFGLAVATMVGLSVGAYWAAGSWVYVGYQGGVGNYSTFVVVAVPILGYLLWASRSRVQRVAIVSISAGLLFTGFWTLNRALWPALVVEFVVAAVLWLGFSGRWRASIIAVLSIAAVALPFAATFDKRFGEGGAESMDTLLLQDPRLPMWATAVTAIAERPLVGVGFGRDAFGKAYQGRPGTELGHAHNFFLNRGVQLGVIGLLLTVTLFGALAASLWRIFRSCPDRTVAYFAAAALVYLAGLLAKNMTDDFFIREVSLLFWSIMGLALGAARRFPFRSAEQAK